MNYYEEFSKNFYVPEYQEYPGTYEPGPVEQDIGIGLKTLCLMSVEVCLDPKTYCREYLFNFTLESKPFDIKVAISEDFSVYSSEDNIYNLIKYEVALNLQLKVQELTGKFVYHQKFKDFLSNSALFPNHAGQFTAGYSDTVKFNQYPDIQFEITVTAGNSGTGLSSLASQLPGVLNLVNYPCEHFVFQDRLDAVIVHLNDSDKWTREKIADWLDDLADSGTIDINFDEGIELS